jgi:putative hemolysin
MQMLDFQHILEDYYPEFVRHRRRTANAIARLLNILFLQERFKQFEHKYSGLEGFDFVSAALTFFDFSIRLPESQKARIPATGRLVIASNHPIGSLDGIALLDLVRQVRTDVRVVANGMLMHLKPLHSVLLPVNNMSGSTTRRDLLAIRKHLESDGVLIIFPAGEVSRLGLKGVRDGLWNNGFVKLASATKAPILPVFMGGRNSAFFYGLSALVKPLSTAWLIREMFKQQHKTVDVHIGRPIPYSTYSANGFSTTTLTAMFKTHVYQLTSSTKPVFESVDSVAQPELRSALIEELAHCDHLGTTPDGKQIYLTTMAQSPCIMREIGVLREITFRLAGEGSGLARDIDQFDQDYYQLLLWDDAEHEIVGAYRLGDASELIDKRGVNGLYTSSLFEFDAQMDRFFRQGLELGRSFVQPKYQSRYALDYLWSGIGAFVKQRPRIRYLFGSASISRFYKQASIERIAYYYGTHFSHIDVGVTPKTPLLIGDKEQTALASEFAGRDAEDDFKTLRDALAKEGRPVPVLYKHYARATRQDGVTFTAFNIDPNFNDCVDGFVIADLTKLKPKKKNRYLGTDWTPLPT